MFGRKQNDAEHDPTGKAIQKTGCRQMSQLIIQKRKKKKKITQQNVKLKTHLRVVEGKILQIKNAKNESLENFGEMLTKNKRLANKTFFKVVRNMQKRDKG